MAGTPTTKSGGRAEAWRSFAAELELVETDEMAGKLRDQLGLGEGEVGPVYALERPGQPRLVVFDQRRERAGPLGSSVSSRTGVLVRAAPDVDLVSMRVTERLGRAMEMIEAGRTGSRRVPVPHDPAFESQLSVFARDDAGVGRALTSSVRACLSRLIGSSERSVDDAGFPIRGRVAPVVVVGGRNVLLLLEEPEPVPFDRLASSAVEVLGLYAALSVTAGGRGDRP